MQARQNYLKEDRVTSCDKEILPSDKYKRDDQVEITIFFLMVIHLTKTLSILYPFDTLSTNWMTEATLIYLQVFDTMKNGIYVSCHLRRVKC